MSVRPVLCATVLSLSTDKTSRNLELPDATPLGVQVSLLNSKVARSRDSLGLKGRRLEFHSGLGLRGLAKIPIPKRRNSPRVCSPRLHSGQAGQPPSPKASVRPIRWRAGAPGGEGRTRGEGRGRGARGSKTGRAGLKPTPATRNMAGAKPPIGDWRPREATWGCRLAGLLLRRGCRRGDCRT